MERIAGRNGAARLAIVYGEEADVGAAGFACDAEAPVGTDDVAGVEQGERRGEVAGVLEEEGAQFGEVDRIALVDGELRLIALDVAEVGIECGVEDDGVTPDGLGLAAESCLGVAGAEVGIVGIELVENVEVLAEDIRIELDVVGAGDAFDALQ